MIIFVTIMDKLLLAVLGGGLLAFSWPSVGFSPLIFIAFIPLLVLENKCSNGKQVFWHSFLAFFIFNIITTYWIFHATLFGAVAAFVINSFLMAMVFWLFHKIKKTISNRLRYLFFIVGWISMEYLHLNWDLSWPWLVVGNVFANFPAIIQWYEFTGFLGGSIWVLLINLLLFRVYQAPSAKKTILFTGLIFFLPMLFSYYMYVNFQKENHEILNVVIVQPNVDPYSDKFTKGYRKQLADFIELAKTSITEETELLLGPETVLLERIWENKIEETYSIGKFRELQREFPKLHILLGATTYKMFENIEERTNTARQFRNQQLFYDVYNSAVFIPKEGDVQVYHKTKLVPGAEKMPFPYLLDPLAKIAVDLGGISGSLGKSNSLNSFVVDEDIVVSPLICYESVYGDMKLGLTSILAIITNDGWWKQTAGYRQHFNYAALRAVEQRKSIIRSANTGISGILNSRGDILRQSAWDEKVCLTGEVYINNKETFYSRFGDYIGRISVFIFVIFLGVSFVNKRLAKQNPTY